jgi:hypothetical protein
MRQRGRTIQPRQRQPQQKETHADRDVPLSQSPVTCRYHLLAKVAESMVEKLTVTFQKAAVSLTPPTWHQTSTR